MRTAICGGQSRRIVLFRHDLLRCELKHVRTANECDVNEPSNLSKTNSKLAVASPGSALGTNSTVLWGSVRERVAVAISFWCGTADQLDPLHPDGVSRLEKLKGSEQDAKAACLPTHRMWDSGG